MINDIELFRAKLGKIYGAAALGDKLLELVQAKSVSAALFDADSPEPANDDQEKEQENGSDSAQ